MVWLIANGAPLVLPVGWNSRQSRETPPPAYIELGGPPVTGGFATALVEVPVMSAAVLITVLMFYF